MSLITPDFGLIFWMTLIFAAVFFVLAKWGFPMIVDSVEERSKRIGESIRMAKEAEQKLALMAEQQEALLQKAKSEQAKILKETAVLRDSMISQAKEDAQHEAAKVLEAAKLQIESEKESALIDIKNQVAALSVEVAEKILRKSLADQKSQMELLDRLVDEISDKKS